MESWRLIEEYLPLEIRSPRGGGGKSGSKSGGKSGGKSGSSGSSSSSSSGGKGNSGSGSSSSSGGSSSKSGSGSSSSSGGTTVVVVGGGSTYNNYHGGGGGGGYIGSLPTWAVVLIIWVSVILTLFLCALLYYCLKGQYIGTFIRSPRSASAFIVIHVEQTLCCRD